MKTLILLLSITLTLVVHSRAISTTWEGPTVYKNPSMECPHCHLTWPQIPKTLCAKEKRMLKVELWKSYVLHYKLSHPTLLHEVGLVNKVSKVNKKKVRKP